MPTSLLSFWTYLLAALEGAEPRTCSTNPAPPGAKWWKFGPHGFRSSGPVMRQMQKRLIWSNRLHLSPSHRPPSGHMQQAMR